MQDARIQDQLAIARLIQLVARAYDQKRHDELLPVLFEANARQHYYVNGKLFDLSFPRGIESLKQVHSRCYSTIHLVSPPVIDFEGDTARASSAVQGIHVQIRHDGTRSVWAAAAYYHDVLIRGQGSWRIRERVATVTHESGGLLGDVRLYHTLPNYAEAVGPGS